MKRNWRLILLGCTALIVAACDQATGPTVRQQSVTSHNQTCRSGYWVWSGNGDSTWVCQ